MPTPVSAALKLLCAAQMLLNKDKMSSVNSRFMSNIIKKFLLVERITYFCKKNWYKNTNHIFLFIIFVYLQLDF